jgi:hypothetical protein
MTLMVSSLFNRFNFGLNFITLAHSFAYVGRFRRCGVRYISFSFFLLQYDGLRKGIFIKLSLFFEVLMFGTGSRGGCSVSSSISENGKSMSFIELKS